GSARSRGRARRTHSNSLEAARVRHLDDDLRGLDVDDVRAVTQRVAGAADGPYAALRDPFDRRDPRLRQPCAPQYLHSIMAPIILLRLPTTRFIRVRSGRHAIGARLVQPARIFGTRKRSTVRSRSAPPF